MKKSNLEILNIFLIDKIYHQPYKGYSIMTSSDNGAKINNVIANKGEKTTKECQRHSFGEEMFEKFDLAKSLQMCIKTTTLCVFMA